MKKINFNSCIEHDNKLWFVTHNRYFMYYDIDSDEYKAVVPSNIEDVQIRHIVDDMFFYDEKIYFFEQDASVLYEYDIKSNYLYNCELPHIKMVDWECFACICVKNNNIYMFTKENGKIYCYNMDTKKIEYIENYRNKALVCSMMDSDNAYLVTDNSILVYDLNNKKYKSEYFVDKDIKKIHCYNNEFYIITRNEEIYLSDTSFDKWKLIYKDENCKQTIHMLVISNKKIFIFPSTIGNILSINKKTNVIVKEIVPDDMKYFISGWSKFYGQYEAKNRIWIANRQANYLAYIDKDSEELNWIKIKGCNTDEILPYLKHKMVFDENELDIEEFIKLYVEKV